MDNVSKLKTTSLFNYNCLAEKPGHALDWLVLVFGKTLKCPLSSERFFSSKILDSTHDSAFILSYSIMLY